MPDRIKKVAVTGPESTGKSVLARSLADYFRTSWVEEYAREYLEKIQRPYDENDILEIAKGQLKNEERLLRSANGIFFCDTELIVTKIWSEVKYKRCNSWIIDNIILNPYDLYLLCDIDLPWVDDPQREHPHMRRELFLLYHDELVKRGVPFSVISGTGEARLKNALRALKDHGII